MKKINKWAGAFVIWFILLIMVIPGVDIMLSRFISRPLNEISRTAGQMADLDFSAHCNIHTDDEFGELSQSLNAMSASLRETLKKLETANEQLEKDVASEHLLLAAVGFLGIASVLFKEKQMGIICVHGVLPVGKTAFILSKLLLFLICDLVFSLLLTVINLGVSEGFALLPYILLQTGILSLIMALTGFFCAILLRDFKQFSLLYLVLAIFITTPVFLAGQTGTARGWINYHPMYHLFMAMKNAYRGIPSENGIYHAICGLTIVLLSGLVRRALIPEMAKEG